MQSLYIHFPFCETKCHYCDFYSLGRERTRPTDGALFEQALKLEVIQSRSLLASELETLFFGGGTPSMTSYDSMSRALEPLWTSTSISPHTEWTMEANPSSIELNSFKAFRNYGINRISMGVQAMQSEFLKTLGRAHSREQALQALETVFAAGFENVSVDLLCGVPGQTLDHLEESIRFLTQFPITHLSCYLLTLAPHHRMHSQLPDEDTQLSHLLFIHDQLTRLGFAHYEISNFARPGKEARHNLCYWRGKSYLGLGPSAHSYDSMNHRRWKNISSLHKYSSLLTQGEKVIEWTESLTPEQLELEKWMLALRLSEGFPRKWLTQPFQQERVKLFKNNGLIEAHPEIKENDRLTPKGFALSDQVIRALV